MGKGLKPPDPREASLPQITTIDQIETILPRYVWVDEDDKQVSPIHKELRSAFNFVNGWQHRFDRLITEASEQGEKLTEEEIKHDSRFQTGYQKMTRSGKPPVKLKRIKISIEVLDPTEEEQTLAKVMLGRLGDSNG